MKLALNRPALRLGLTALTALSIASYGALAHADRKACDRDYKPQVGQAGKDVVWVPTPDELVNKMLSMAKVTPQDMVYDLGAGDGKIAIAAGRLGATAVGIEYNPDMARLADCYVKADGVANRVSIINGDIFKENFSRATVVTMYLLPELNLRLRPIILDMRPGTRVTSHQFTMGDWEPDEIASFEYRTAYLWIVPAKVQGGWAMSEASGSTFNVTLNQTFQKLSGEVAPGGNAGKRTLAGSMRGADLAFAFIDAAGVTRTVQARVQGNEMSGVMKGSDGSETRVSGKRSY